MGVVDLVLDETGLAAVSRVRAAVDEALGSARPGERDRRIDGLTARHLRSRPHHA